MILCEFPEIIDDISASLKRGLNLDFDWPDYILKLDDSLIGPRGAIYHPDGELRRDSNFYYNYWNAWRNHLDGNTLSTGRMKDNNFPWPHTPIDSSAIKGSINIEDFKVINLPDDFNYIYCHHFFNMYVFGHIWDNLQDLDKVEDLKNKRLIIPQWRGQVKNLNLHLELFGYPEKSRTPLNLPGDSKTLYRVPTLYYPSPTARPSQITERGLKYLRSKYYTLCDNPPEETKLYLHRPKLRTVKNDSEVIDFLKKYNFTILDGTEGIREHVRLFRNASTIIGPHGSMFRNMIFSDKNPKVFEFCAHNRLDHNFENIGKTMKLDYTWIETEADDDFNIQIDLDVLRDIIGA